MADRPLDEAFAQHLIKVGLVTEAQVKAALQAQAERALKGETVLLGDILVQQGILTAEQRENIEKKLDTQREEAKRLGPYRILKKLGEGGMGAVYLAEDVDQNKVALKVLPKVTGRDQDAVRRFMREVDAAKKLDHPNIVRASGGGEDKGFHYYVMEYVEGETLGGRLKREESLPPDDATKLIFQVAQGLKYAHEQGFIHRDIKPDNVVVSREGVAKILDMGLSKNIDEAQSFLTLMGVAIGTPQYIAPEQARGEKGIDGRADIYSLGATYYHLVTGETPFHGTTVLELIAQHLNKQLPDPRDIRDGIPDGVVHIIRRMMAKKPGDRYRDCGELITDLELVLRGSSPSSRALDAASSAVGMPMERQARERYRAERLKARKGTVRATTRSKPSSAPLIVGAAVAAVLAIVLAVTMSGGSPPSPPVVVVPKGEPPKPFDSAGQPGLAQGKPRAPAKTREELRQEEAQRKLDEIKVVGKRFADDEVRRRYAEFAREYADTPQGKTIAGWLASSEAKPKEPKPPSSAPSSATEGKPEPAIAEAPKVADAPKPTEPAPAEPIAKPPPAASKRPAVPEAAKLREAEAAYRKAFKPEQAKTSQEKVKLARTLLETAAKDAELYVLLRQARDLGAQGRDAKTALEAIDARAAAFDVDAMEEKVDLFSKTKAKGMDAAAWAGAALDVAEEASEADDYETAVKLAGRAEALARVANDRGLHEWANERDKELADLKREWDRIKSHGKTLEAKPDDPVANAAVGKFLCLVKDDWERGLSLMAKGTAGAVKELVERELSKPADAAAQAVLGEAWAAQAQKEAGTYKAAARARAAGWLVRAIPGLAGPAKVTAEKKLASLGPVVSPKIQISLHLGGGVMMDLVYIKPGTFTMGSTDAPKQGWQADEKPEHRVTITMGFYLGKYEVTQAQWEVVMGSNPSTLKGPELPVDQVSWEDCQSFLKKLNEKAKNQLKGRMAALPTEAQWEYACRAGTKTGWGFGEDRKDLGEHGWVNVTGGMHAVGQKKPNGWGLYDMHGNVWEWCQDWVAPYAGDATDPTGPAIGNRRCLRSGSWMDTSTECRSSYRNGGYTPERRIAGTGFRVAAR